MYLYTCKSSREDLFRIQTFQEYFDRIIEVSCKIQLAFNKYVHVRHVPVTGSSAITNWTNITFHKNGPASARVQAKAFNREKALLNPSAITKGIFFKDPTAPASTSTLCSPPSSRRNLAGRLQGWTQYSSSCLAQLDPPSHGSLGSWSLCLAQYWWAGRSLHGGQRGFCRPCGFFRLFWHPKDMHTIFIRTSLWTQQDL